MMLGEQLVELLPRFLTGRGVETSRRPGFSSILKAPWLFRRRSR
jgi:hypothetical protein